MRLIAVTLTAAIAATCLVACGGDKSNADKYSGEKAKVARVVDELGAAARNGDGDRICRDLFTKNLRISIARASKRACPAEVTQKVFDRNTKYDLQDLVVQGNQATADVKDQKNRKAILLFLKEAGQWRIAKVS